MYNFGYKPFEGIKGALKRRSFFKFVAVHHLLFAV